MGAAHEEPTPALRATPPGRGFLSSHQLTRKIQVLFKCRSAQTPTMVWIRAAQQEVPNGVDRVLSLLNAGRTEIRIESGFSARRGAKQSLRASI